MEIEMAGYQSSQCVGWKMILSQFHVELTCLGHISEWNRAHCRNRVFTSISSGVVCSFSAKLPICWVSGRDRKRQQRRDKLSSPPTTHHHHRHPLQFSSWIYTVFSAASSSYAETHYASSFNWSLWGGILTVGETKVHNDMNLDPVISTQTRHFECLAPGSVNWCCI